MTIDVDGPIDVNGQEITPITKKPIERVDADNWGNLSVQHLHDELFTLRMRKQMLIEMGKHEVIPFIDGGIARIEHLITQRQIERSKDKRRL